MNNDIYIRRGPRPQGQPRGLGPGLVALLVISLGALAVVVGMRWMRGREAAEPRDTAPSQKTEGRKTEGRKTEGQKAENRVPVPAPPPASAVQPSRTVATPGPSSPGADPALPALTEARALTEAGQIPAARDKALGALAAAQTPAVKRQIEDLLGGIHTALVFTPAPMAEKVDYTIQPGDRLAGIAKQHGTTIELLTKGNGIRSSVIRPGDRLRVLTGKFSVLIDKSENDLVLSLSDRFFKRYRVGTGKFEKTPAGRFRITDRIAQPTWWRSDGKAVPYGDKENVLGTHWLSLDIPRYGIHGTWEPETVGKQESAGCIRLVNADIEELYALLPVGTPVAIQE